MDHIRSCYETDCRFYPDQPDNITRIRWYFAEPGALKLPYRHHFGSRIWEQPTTGNGDVGELVPGNRRWYSGENFAGRFGLGTSIPEAKWFEGCSADEGLTGLECEPGFWEAVRLGFKAVSFSLVGEHVQTVAHLGEHLKARLQELRTILPLRPSHGGFISSAQPAQPPHSEIMHLGVFPAFDTIKGTFRRFLGGPGFGVPGRVGKPIIFRERPKHGAAPLLKGPGKVLVAQPPPGGFVAILEGPGKVLVAQPPAGGFAPILKGPGKVLVAQPPPGGFAPILKGPGKVLVAQPPPGGFAPILKGPGKVLAAQPPLGLAPLLRAPGLFATGACVCLSGSGTAVPLREAHVAVVGQPWVCAVAVERDLETLVSVSSSAPWLCSVGSDKAPKDANVVVAGVAWSCAVSLDELHPTTCCSNAFPHVLHATLANNAGCSCATGSISITWNSATSRWEGSGAFGSCPTTTLWVRFYCLAGGMTSASLRVDYSFDNVTYNTISPSVTPTCSPLSAAFISLASGANCNGPGLARTFKITIAP